MLCCLSFNESEPKTNQKSLFSLQTNVFPNAQKRKARPFEGVVRKCVVVVPSDDDYKARVKAQEEAGCKDIPDDAIMEMKGRHLTLNTSLLLYGG